jgi:predicted membrane protein (TIGR00267 family)
MGGGRLREALAASIREVVFGLEDSFVSTMGAVSGIAVGCGNANMVILSGLVIVTVEAISMAAGSYLSSKAAREVYEERLEQDSARVLSERVTDRESLKEFFVRKNFTKEEISVALQAIGRERRQWLDEVHRAEFRMSPAASSAPLVAGIVMGVCYLIGGLIVLIPYFFLPLMFALPLAVVITCCCLFLLGFWKANIAGVKPLRSGVEMVTVSLGAAFLGIVIGRLASVYFRVAI